MNADRSQSRSGGPSVKRRRADRAGRSAEALCALALRLTGHHILARRFRTPVGELDIVARKGPVLAFIEVKARASFALAAESIAARQRQRVERAAGAYLAAHPALARLDPRFDAMLVAPWRWPRHLRDAWRP
ncbi:MAG TPA: YraN family protein [Alphaproteobacteria bacterium]|nr:YraN family protein [Alphaproteobacteria bacterium]